MNTAEDKDTELILLFVSCENHKDRWPRIDRMCERLGIKSYFVVSGGASETIYNNARHRICLACDDTYEYLPSKILMMLRETHLRYANAIVWKIDDDVEIFASDTQVRRGVYKGISLLGS